MTDDDTLFDLSTPARLRRFACRIINTRYFFVAFLLHALMLALFGAKVIFEGIQAKGIFEPDGPIVTPGPPGKVPMPPPSPPVQPKQPQEEDREVSDKVNAATTPSRTAAQSATRILIAKVDTPFTLPDAPLPGTLPDVSIRSDEGLKDKLARAEFARLQGVDDFFRKAITGEGGKRGLTGSGKEISAQFTCYVGKYSGADWDCNFGFIADKRWYGNCIYNLMLQISRWTQGRVKAVLKPEALELASREWLEKVKPPFIFITGHEDFVLDPSEVENLKEYLMMGGALWVDSSLPGRRSRFDVALRRELKKVLPDRDFEPLPNNHPLFKSYYEFTGSPAAMNYYKEPVEVIKVGAGGGDVAVLYTLNAYSDLWETGLTEKDKIDKQSDWSSERQGPVWRTGPHYGAIFGNWQSEVFYRNVNEASIVNSYKFGINIVFYLLTRYQDKLRVLPM